MPIDRVPSVPRSKFVKEEYPNNLLLSIQITTANEIEVPNEITSDIIAGIEYSLSTLDERERRVLHLRFVDRKKYEEIGDELNVSVVRARQIEMKAFCKLREPKRWNYIRYGVNGNLKSCMEMEYQKGYADGYKAGCKESSTHQEEAPSAPISNDDFRKLGIEILNLTKRSYSCLHRAGYNTIGDILSIDVHGINRIRNFGRISANEVAKKLSELGMENSEWNKFIIKED